MGAGIIVAIVVIAGLAYLVPWYISRREDVVDDEVDPFTNSMTLIRRSTGALVETEAEEFEVSTPMTRRAALAEVRDAHRAAAIRRRRGVLTLLLAVVGVGAAIPFTVLPWWSVLVPTGLLVAFVALARWSTVTLTRSLDARVAQLREGWMDDTISFEVPAELRSEEELTEEFSIDLGAPSGVAGSLWDPIPVTAPTYMSKPLVPRTVRTIDLSAPSQPQAPRVPVTNETRALERDLFTPSLDDQVAEAEARDADAVERRRAVGE